MASWFCKDTIMENLNIETTVRTSNLDIVQAKMVRDAIARNDLAFSGEVSNTSIRMIFDSPSPH